MPSSEEIRDRALQLAAAGSATDQAVADLLVLCGDRRTAVVLARQSLYERAEAGEGSETVTRAIGLLSETLEQGQWA